MRKVFVFGNPDLIEDSLPLKILSKLRKKFPDIDFEVKDPNEEWSEIREIVVIDTVVGIEDVEVFNDLQKFSKPPNLTAHDFDALSNLRYLQKLGKIENIKIIGLPQNLNKDEALSKTATLLETIFPAK